MPRISRTKKRLGYAMLGAAALLAGCGGGEEAVPHYEDLQSYEAIELTDDLVEAPLGDYSVPVPVADDSKHGRSHRLLFKFSLFALVDPSDATQTERLAERQQGQLRDRVINVCRRSSLEDLLDPQLSTLRSRVLDAIQPLFDGLDIDRVLIVGQMTEPL